jgi:hypothetical protein
MFESEKELLKRLCQITDSARQSALENEMPAKVAAEVNKAVALMAA